MKRIITISIIAVFMLSACDRVETHRFRSYVIHYWDMEQMVLGISDAGNIIIGIAGGGKHYSWNSKGQEKAIYDSLCILHNDITYNKKRDYIAGPDWGSNYKGDITSIHVVSDADFDEQHPADSSLNDLIRFLSISVYPYILSGYQPFDWEKNLPVNFQCEENLCYQSNRYESECYYPIDKKLSEITPFDMVLVDLRGVLSNSQGEYGGSLLAYLVFEKQPETIKEHELTVTITLSDGRVFSPKITKVFE